MRRQTTAPFPLYTTFHPGELEETLRQLDPEGKYRTIGSVTTENRRGRSSLVKEHICCVCYPDGTQGECRYVRYGPAWHQFTYTHTTVEGDAILPRQSSTQRLTNTIAAIEETVQEIAKTAFDSAIFREREDYFRRSAEPIYPAKRPMLPGWLSIPQVTARRAKEIAGKYALCRLLNGKLFPLSQLFDSIEEANTVWRESGNTALFVCCLCRWSRRWELPRFNALYREFPLPTLEKEPPA